MDKKEGREDRTSREDTAWDSLSQDSESEWRRMQEERSFAERPAVVEGKEKGDDDAIEPGNDGLQDTAESDGKVIGDSDWSVSPTQWHANLKLERRQNEVAQEYIERSLNESFMTMDELEAVFEGGVENSSMRTVEYEGKIIKIYNTGNVPFRFLEHSIQYRGAIGTPLVEDPSLWDKSEDDARQEFGYKFSNMLSMQYRDSVMRREQGPPFGIGYGMLRMPPGSVAIINTGGQPRNKTKDDISLLLTNWQEAYSPSELADEIAGMGFVEVQSFRYDEQGKVAFRPDFIEAPVDGINDATLKQAVYFGVPIFEIPQRQVKTEKEIVDENIHMCILRNVIEYEQDHAPDQVEKHEERLHRLAETPTGEWTRRDRYFEKELYALVKEREELKEQSHDSRRRAKTKEEKIKEDIQMYILKKTVEREQEWGRPPDDVDKYEEKLQRLAEIPAREWALKDRILEKELFMLVKEKEELKEQPQD